MTRIDAIKEADRLKPNAFPAEDKLRWLERLEKRIRREILLQHEGTVPALGNFGSEELNLELLVPSPYDEMYIHWLCAQMDYYNGEPDSFNASNAMFEAMFGQFRNDYRREHRPLSREKRYS